MRQSGLLRSRIKDLLIAVLVPNDFLGFLRLIASVLALIALLRRAFLTSYSAVLESLVASYQSAVDTIFSPLQPLVVDLTETLSRLLPLTFSDDGAWQHIFLILGFYFFGRLRNALTFHHWGTAAFRLVWGALIAFVVLVSVASAEIEMGSNLQHFALVTLCVVGMVVYELGINIWFATFLREHQARLHDRAERSWAAEFFHLSQSDLARGMIAVLLGGTVAVAIPSEGPKAAGIISFAVIMLLYGGFWIYWATLQLGSLGAVLLRDRSEPNADGEIGLSLIGIYFWTAVLVAVDAGLRAL